MHTARGWLLSVAIVTLSGIKGAPHAQGGADATMDLYSILTPADLSLGDRQTAPSTPMEKTRARRIVRKRAAPNSSTPRRGRGRGRRGAGLTRSESKTSGSGRTTPPHTRTLPPPRERLRRARAAAAERTRGRTGARVAMDMDAILDAQAPTAGLDADDLRDAVEACERAARGVPSAEEDVLADMLVPGRREARRAAVWRELDAAAALLEYNPPSLFLVSAERSTAMWEGSLAHDGNCESHF